jgi:PIN domain nuclease of toxin-antitoxin system
MKLLIDTHALIWWWTDVDRLSATAIDLLSDPGVRVLVSAVTAYEIELKRSRDPLLQRLPAELLAAVNEEGFEWRDVIPADAIVAGRLPLHHRDPWDRLLVAQATRDDAAMLSRDAALAVYGATLLW